MPLDLMDRIVLDIKTREANTKIYYLDRMVDEIERGYFCIFAGAGLSAASGYVDWKTLLEPMGRQLGLNMNIDLTLLAQYYENEFTRDELNRRIQEEFAKIPQSNRNMEILASMPIRRYWTTNYDSIIEDTLRNQKKIVDVIIDQLQFKYHSPTRDAIVLKMHGDKTLPDSAVLCKNDYENYDEDRSIFTQSLTLDLISNTFLFVGFSFSDPNLDRIIAIVKRNFKGASPKKHYCFMRTIHVNDYIENCSDVNKAKEEFEQDFNAQECKIRDMRRYGIETIEIENFDQITQMLEYMRDRLKLNSVFIAGATRSDSPTDYGSFQEFTSGKLGRAEKFILRLAEELIANHYNLVSGFGVGVGNYVVAGAYTQKSNTRDTRLEERVHIQPMISIENDNLKIKNQIRTELLDRCGIVITMFGKSKACDQVDTDGTYIEYELAKENKKIVIPIGATGFTSKIIYDKEKDEWQDKRELEIYQTLGNEKEKTETLIKAVIDGIEYKKKKREEEMRQLLVQNFFEPESSTEKILRQGLPSQGVSAKEHPVETGEADKKKKLSQKVFLSFQYSSSFRYANMIIHIIQKSGKYWIIEEQQKCEDCQIQQWIDTRMEDIDVTIVFFNKEFSDSKWTDYEVKQSVAKNIPFLFLVKEQKRFCSSKDTLINVKEYISQKKIKHYRIFEWKLETDFEQIPSELDRLLEEC